MIHRIVQPRKADNYGIPYHVFVDEFQRLELPVVADIISQDRKRGLIMTMAHQWRDQLENKQVQTATAAANVVFMGKGQRDKKFAEQQGVRTTDTNKLNVGEFFVRWGIEDAIQVYTELDLANPSETLTEAEQGAVLAQIAKTYYRPIETLTEAVSDDPKPDSDTGDMGELV